MDVQKEEVTGKRGRRRKQLLDGLKETIANRKLRKESRDRTMWRTRFGRGYGPVGRLRNEWLRNSSCM